MSTELSRTGMNRSCPVCSTLLRPVHLGAVVIDFCTQCRGSWCDADELQKAYSQKHRGGTLLIPALTEHARDPVICLKCSNPNPRTVRICQRCHTQIDFLCPVCRNPMEEISKNGIAIDRCLQCKGVWLDGGELKTLFEKYSQTIQHKGATASNVAGVAGQVALDMLIWAPDITILATANLLSHVPDLASKGLEIAGNMPEIAGKAVEGVMSAAGGATELAGTAVSGMIDVAGSVGEAASGAASSFLEIIVGLLAGIFD